jgi:hypothetical protein
VFAWPAWTSTAAAIQAVRGAGFITARGPQANSYLQKSYSMYNVGFQFMADNLWSSGLDLKRVRGFASQARANFGVCSTMLHSYSQFNAAGTLETFEDMLDELIACGVVFKSQSTISSRILGDSDTWGTVDSGLTYTFNAGEFPTDNTNIDLVYGAYIANNGDVSSVDSIDFKGDPVFGYPIGARSYQYSVSNPVVQYPGPLKKSLKQAGPDLYEWQPDPQLLDVIGVNNACFGADGTAVQFATPALALAALASLADDQYLFGGLKGAALYSVDMSAKAEKIKRILGDVDTMEEAFANYTDAENYTETENYVD